MSIFDNIITGSKVEQAVADTLKLWLPTYVREVERQEGLAHNIKLPDEGNIRVNTELNKFNEDRLPAIIIVSPGLTEAPVRQGNGAFRAVWNVGVASVVRGKDRQDTDRTSKIMTAAIRTLLIQRPDLGLESGRGCSWISESYSEMDSNDRRTLQAGLQTFWVEVDNVATWGSGPIMPNIEPPEDPTVPYPDPPTIEQGKTFLTTENNGVEG